jgi:hypothetical protein
VKLDKAEVFRFG